MTDREKLYALMKEAVRNCDPGNTCLDCRYRTRTDCMERVTADYLIANGVVVREKGEWKYYRKQGIAVCTSCSFERKVDDNFGRAVACPNCGADMRRRENG